jgi:hypothetical protein
VPYAEKALLAMQQMLGMRVHPVLEPLYKQLEELKRKAGDEEGGQPRAEREAVAQSPCHPPCGRL